MGYLTLIEKFDDGNLLYSPEIFQETLLNLSSGNKILFQNSFDVKPSSFSLAKIIPDGDIFWLIPLNSQVSINNKPARGFFRRRFLIANNDQIKIGEIVLQAKIEKGLGARPYPILEFICHSNGFAFTKSIYESKWLQFDKQNRREFTKLAVNERLAESEILNNKPFSQKENLKSFYKVYINLSSAYIFSGLDLVLKTINTSKIPFISGKVALLEYLYSLPNGDIVLYVIGKKEKDNLVNELIKIKFDKKALNLQPILYCKRENSFICWNQGGNPIRRAAKSIGAIKDYFAGENLHLINPKKLD